MRLRIARFALAAACAGLGLFALERLHVAASVGTGYAAKVICSLAFNSGQQPERVLRKYVSHEIAPLGAALRLRVDRDSRQVEASSLGWVRAQALYREGLGCTLVADSTEATLLAQRAPRDPRPALDPTVRWPFGAAGPDGSPPARLAQALDGAFSEPTRQDGFRRQTTAVVITHEGRLLAERYAEGYGPATPMLSWSMAKSVLASLVGIAASDGLLDLRAPAPVPEWRRAGDPRARITVDQLLRMSSGLAFDETYGAVNDVSRMLFTRSDTGAFAAAMPLAADPDRVWSYSSGTSNILARVLREAFDDDLEHLVRFSRERLFDAASMTSAFFEPDGSGSFVGSSFVFATARDWARFGQLHLDDGVWGGRRVLPQGWVRYVTTPTPTAPDGGYGAHWWLNAGDPEDPARRMWPSLPADLYAARGHSGQYVVVVPSARLVVVRLGLAHADDDGLHGIEELIGTALASVGRPGA